MAARRFNLQHFLEHMLNDLNERHDRLEAKLDTFQQALQDHQLDDTRKLTDLLGKFESLDAHRRSAVWMARTVVAAGLAAIGDIVVNHLSFLHGGPR